MRNARFYAYINGQQVKLTLKPGQQLKWETVQRTDEGWQGEYHAWQYVKDGIMSQIGTDGRDCDGRLATWGDYFCPLDRLQSGNRPYDDETAPAYPDWVETRSEQFDEYAEAAGY